MAEITLIVDHLHVQKDEYEVGGTVMGETEFWGNPANTGAVESFKRLTATCRMEGPFGPPAFEVQVMLRGGFFRVQSVRGGTATAEQIATTLISFFGPRIWARVVQPRARHALCMIDDVNWLASMLHEAKVEGGLTANLAPAELTIPQR